MTKPWQTVLDFWFGDRQDPTYGKPRKEWFIKSLDFDEQVKKHLRDRHQQAKLSELDAWQDDPLGCLALIIVLDQAPRNLFRNTPQSFATDPKALDLAKIAISKHFDQQLLPVQCWFIYLPFEHSENLEDQHQSLKLFASLQGDPDSASTITYAQQHFDVIDKFGRFPHRNQILGRTSTPAELEFLKQPHSSF